MIAYADIEKMEKKNKRVTESVFASVAIGKLVVVDKCEASSRLLAISEERISIWRLDTHIYNCKIINLEL